MLLLQHLRLGDVPHYSAQGCDRSDKGEDRPGDTERDPDLHGERETLFHFLHVTRQRLLDALQSLAKCTDGQGNGTGRTVAVDPLRVR